MEPGIRKHLSLDPNMAAILEGLTLPPVPEYRRDIYSSLIRSVVFQQLSTKAASTIYGRFLDLFPDGHPHPFQLRERDIEELRSAGLSRQKSAYLINIAEFWMLPENKDTDWHALTDDEIVNRLTMIKGVGVWTAQMILMSSLQRPDVFPHLDQGLQQAIKLCYNLPDEGRSLREASIAIAENWRPYRSYACRVLWYWFDNHRDNGK